MLRPNGKLCINAPIMPIPKAVIEQHTRHLKNIAFDIEHKILAETDLERYSLFVWQKQTSKMMFGSYPYPGNAIENNTIEFINVYVKPGKPPKFPPHVKAANEIDDFTWRDFIQQVWFVYPADVARVGHPNPFPPKLPARLIKMYTHGAAADFPGETVLDPFCGSGTTCVAARHWVGATSASISTRNTPSSRTQMSPTPPRSRPCWSSVGPSTPARMSSCSRLPPATAARMPRRSTRRRATAPEGPDR